MLPTSKRKLTNYQPTGTIKSFCDSGGHVVVSYAHLARCVCRRAERFITELNETQPIAPPIIAFVNLTIRLPIYVAESLL